MGEAATFFCRLKYAEGIERKAVGYVLLRAGLSVN